MVSPIGTDHLTRPFFPVPMSKKKSGLGSETILNHTFLLRVAFNAPSSSNICCCEICKPLHAYRVMFCVARSISAPVAYRYFDYKRRCHRDACFPGAIVFPRTRIPRDACFPAHMSYHSDTCFPGYYISPS